MKKHFYSILRTISSIYGRYNLQNSETTESGVDNVVSSCEKIPSKHQLNEFSLGRSMVEMLGVLAIIGVLSVGAISGYSKAMMKYKMNKHAEAFNTLLNNAIQLYPDLTRDYINNKYSYDAGARWLLNIFDKMNLIPDGMHTNTRYIEDIFKNQINFTYFNGNNGASNEYLMYVQFNRDNKNTLTEHDRQVCRNFVSVAKENANNLAWLEMRSYKSDEHYNSSYLYGGLAGLFLKVPSRNLLHNADIKQIDDFCSSCNSEHECSLVIYITVTRN